MRKTRRRTNHHRISDFAALVQSLEDRALLANFDITDAFLVDGAGDRMDDAILGETIGVRVDYTTDDIDQTVFRVEFKVDGVILNLDTGQGTGTNGNGAWYLVQTGWFATAGTHQIEVTIDSDNDVAEDNENDNFIQFTVDTVSATPAFKLLWPAEGSIQGDNRVHNYYDVDPGSGIADFAGGPYAYDGHNAWDIGPSHFLQQDEGIELYASADGTVVSINEGEFDRETEGFNISPTPPANFVIIEHADGYQTYYWHLRRDSVQVEVGQSVQQGDIIGLMGSSGISTGTHIHWGVSRYGRKVEPAMDPDTYLLDEFVYSDDSTIMRSSGVTGSDPGVHFQEGPPRVHVFQPNGAVIPHVWAWFTAIHTNDFIEYIWRRPDGSEFTRTNLTSTQDYRGAWWWWSRDLGTNPPTGQWTVEIFVNGEQLGEESFRVESQGAPEVKVELDGDLILNNRYTPVDFGEVTRDVEDAVLTFEVANYGTAPLEIDDVIMPDGFEIVDGLPSTLAAGATADLRLRLKNDEAGYFAGEVSILSSDSSDADYRFSVEGRVTEANSASLILGIGWRYISENGRTIANVRRTGSTTSAFTVQLASNQPDRIGLPDSVTIPANAEFQSFWIDGLDNVFVDGDAQAIITASASGHAPAHNVLDVLDDDVIGFLLTETDGTTVVGEDGVTDTFDVVLNLAPVDPVVLNVISSNSTEANVDQTSLTFTAANWAVAQTVVVNTNDDSVVDGDTQTTITVSVDETSDSNFVGRPAQSLTATVIDDEVAGFQIMELDGTLVSEAGLTDSIAVVLDAQPVSDVMIAIVQGSDVVTDLSALTFGVTNWNEPQEVTVAAVDDAELEGTESRSLVFRVDADNSDEQFQSIPDQLLDVTIEDNELGSFSVTESGISTIVSEDESSDEIFVVLNIAPPSDVVLVVDVADLSEAAISPGILTFSPANWNVSQTITVTGVDDNVLDDNQQTLVTIAVDESRSHSGFHGLDAQQAVVTNLDNDAPGLELFDVANNQVTEDGSQTDTFQISLASGPSSDVLLEIVALDSSEVRIDSPVLTFTSANWDALQTVSLSGADDGAVDGDILSTVRIEVLEDSDSDYLVVGPIDVSVTTIDDDAAGFTLNDPGTARAVENGEVGAFTVTLDAQPVSNVTFQLESSDTAEADVLQTAISFTPDNWNVPQVIEVEAADDVFVDGDQSVSISVRPTSSSDSEFASLPAQSIEILVSDNDVAGLELDDATGLIATEGGAADEFLLRLTAAPLTPVTVQLTFDEISEMQVSPASIRFTEDNWDLARSVVLTAINDSVVDGDVLVELNVSVTETSDAAFAGLSQLLNVTIEDDDNPGLAVTPIGNTTLHEDGTFVNFLVALEAQPQEQVVLETSILDPDEISEVRPARLTFTSANWSQGQFLTVTAADDDVVDGPQQAVFTLTVHEDSDDAFEVVEPLNTTLTVNDNDVAGFTMTPVSPALLMEGGAEGTFEVQLDHEPLSDVVLTIAADEQWLSVDATTLRFTPSQWNVSQTVSVTARNNDRINENAETELTLLITVDAAQSDALFADVAPQENSVLVADNDEPELVISQTEGSTVVSEDGTSDEFSVRLSHVPSDDVVFALAVDDASEVSVSHQTFTFTTVNWAEPQTVTVTGVDDAVVDGDQTTDMTFASSLSNPDRWQISSTVCVVTQDNVEFTLDVDADSNMQPLTDGILMLRFLAGFTGDSLTANAVGAAAERQTAAEITDWLTASTELLDVDGDGATQPLTDGILVLRYLAGFRGAVLVDGAVSENGTRTTPAAVESWLSGGWAASSGGGSGSAAMQASPSAAFNGFQPASKQSQSPLDDLFAEWWSMN